jgi:hypothetical protein
VISLFSACGKSLAYNAEVDTEAVQQAYDTAVAGDLGPLVDLLHPDLDWSGLERGHLWWKKAPA